MNDKASISPSPVKQAAAVLPFSAICEAVRKIKDAEKLNFKNGIHRKRGMSDPESVRVRTICYRQREERLFALKALATRALPAGIKAGFSGEHVAASLERLLNDVENAAYWDGKCTGPVNDDDLAAFTFNELFDEVTSDLEPLELWSVAASGLAQQQPSLSAGGNHSSAPEYKNPNNVRDKFCYDQMHKGTERKTIRKRIKDKTKWNQLATDQAVTAAAKRYAERNNLPWPIDRKS